jgi:hypothetical protein
MRRYFWLYLVVFTEFTFAACGEETESYCYYFVDDVIKSESPCMVVQCGNVSGGIESWTWSNGNKVSIVVDTDTNRTLVNNNPGFYFSRTGLSCYGIRSSKEALCHSDDVSEQRESHNETRKTEKSGYVGIWAENQKLCVPDGDRVPIDIREKEIIFYESACSFQSMLHDRATWNVKAECSGEGETWTDDFRITVSGDKLTFSRGDEEKQYVRCQ